MPLTIVQAGMGGTGLSTGTPLSSTTAPATNPATGTPSASTYLRGDGTWASVASSQWTTTGSDIYYNTGNVGIGVTPSAWGSGYKALQVGQNTSLAGNTSASVALLSTNAYYDGSSYKYISTDAATQYQQNTGEHIWRTAASGSAGNTLTFTERARIDSSGNFMVGKTTAGANNGNGFDVQPNAFEPGVPFAHCTGNSQNDAYFTFGVYSSSASRFQFYVGYAGTVYARSTSIAGLSDQREKENIRPLETGLNEVLALKPRRFDWKNGQAQNVAGFIAQEVETVLPDLIADYRIDNDETRLGLKMGDMIPTLVKAIQELKAIVDTQAAEIAALKAKV